MEKCDIIHAYLLIPRLDNFVATIGKLDEFGYRFCTRKRKEVMEKHVPVECFSCPGNQVAHKAFVGRCIMSFAASEANQ